MGKQLFLVGIQFFFSSYLFNAPGFSKIKAFVYRLAFGQKYSFKIGHGTYFIASHRSLNGPGKLVVGKNVLIKHRCDLDYSGGLTIGDNVRIAQDVFIATHGHRFKNKALETQKTIEFTPLVIGQNAVIGAGTKILDTVTSIGEGAVISANSLVVKDVPDHTVVMGNPARPIYKRQDD